MMWLKELKLINISKDKYYVLACSGGPDSMALFHLLLDYGINFCVAHVNYHLREESNLEEETLKDICFENAIEFYSFNVEEKITSNIEERCREIRYKFFHKIYRQVHADALLVAHNLDDHLETFLIQDMRNIIPQYYGIKESTRIKGMSVLRPLLYFRKKDLQKYCDSLHAKYFIDKTNLTDQFLRNRIRHLYIEDLDDWQIYNLLSVIDEKNEELKRRRMIIQNRVNINTNDSIRVLDDKVITMVFYDEARKVNPNYEISMKCTQNILKALNSKKPNIQIKLVDNFYFIKEYDSWKFAFINDVSYEYKIDKPGKLDNEYFYLDFTNDSSNRNVTLNDYPLTIRNANEKDRIKVKDYDVEVRRLFIDWKMPISLRKRWPIILDKNNKPIYIPRYQKNFVKDKDTNFYVK